MTHNNFITYITEQDPVENSFFKIMFTHVVTCNKPDAGLLIEYLGWILSHSSRFQLRK